MKYNKIKTKMLLIVAMYGVFLTLPSASGQGVGGFPPPMPTVLFKIKTLEENLSNNNFDQMDVIYFPEDTETIVGITPQSLQEHYLYKFTVLHLSESKKQKSLYLALKSLKPEVLTPEKAPYPTADYRWGCYFYHDGKLISTLFMDGSGRGVMIDGSLFLANPSIKTWLKNNFAHAFE